MNHLSSEKLWWKQIPNPMASIFSQNSSINFHTNEGNDNPSVSDSKDYINKEREAMFEKPLTPSDVGKLNRLVIPKQHAERYFPISANGGGEAVELLSFEDELGKPWRFRYSYWNSSQSYVLTKGWSRFVKEKRLDAGDTIVFERFKNDGDRFFIGWRRRNTVVMNNTDAVVAQAQPAVTGCGWSPVLYSAYPYPSHTPPNGPPLPYQPHCLHAGGGMSAGVKNEMSSGNSKTLRLFGVNLECQIVDEEKEAAATSGGSTWEEPHYHHNSTHVLDTQNHMREDDINFTGDINWR